MNILELNKKLRTFFWKDFCDNYLELVKSRIYNEKGDKKISAQYSLYTSLLTILKMIAPIMPYVTEEIYQEHFKKFEKTKSIHLTDWPIEFGYKIMNGNDWFVLVDIISKVRKKKSDENKSMKAEIILTMDESFKTRLKDYFDDLIAVTNAKEIKVGKFGVEVL